MKIVFVVNELNFFLRTHVNLANQMGKIHQVSLIADIANSPSDDIESLRKMGINLYALNRKKNVNKALTYFSYIFSLAKILKKIKPEYIFYITLELSFFGSLISHFIKVKKSIFIITGLGPFFFKKNFRYQVFNKFQQYGFLLLSIFKKNFLFIFLNSADKDLLSCKYKINSLNCQLIYGEGILDSEFRYIERNETVAKFLLASRLVKSKGIENFIACAKKIKKQYPHAEFSIAGIYDKTNPESISKELFDQIKNTDYVNFLGEIPHHQMEECFHMHNVFVLPSEREGLPRAAVEAASTGMPLILSNVPGCEDCVIEGESGKLIPYMSESELYKAMEGFIDNPSLISLMGKKSSELAKEKFSLNVIASQYLKITS